MKLINFEGHEFEDLMPNLDEFIRQSVNFELCFYNKNSKTKQMYCYCPTANRFFTQAYKKAGSGCSKGYVKDEYKCINEKNCSSCNCKFYNAKYPNKNLKREYDVGFFQKSDRGILFRSFRLTYDFSSDWIDPVGYFDDDKGGYKLARRGEVDYEETERIFFNFNKTVEVYNKYVTVYNPYSGYKICVGHNFRASKFPYDKKFLYVDSTFEDLKKLLYKSFYGYMVDFEETLSLIDEEFSFETYLYAFLKYPLKLALQYGFIRLAKDIYFSCINGGTKRMRGINFRGKTIEKVLGFELSKLPRSIAEDITSEEVGRVRFAIKNGVRITRETFKVIKDISFEQIFKFVSFKEAPTVVRYIINQRKRHKNVFVSEYLFYLQNAKKYGFDLTNKENVYPINLSTVHDNMVSLIKKHNADDLLKAFYKAVMPYSGIKLEYGDYYISPVLTPHSLRRYADKFHNCSYGHCESICEGRSVIFVIKSKLFPLQPCYMFDYSPKSKEVIQLRAVKNYSAPEDIREYVGRYVDKLKAVR